MSYRFISREVRAKVVEELPPRFSRKECDELAAKYDLSSNSIRGIGERAGKEFQKQYIRGKSKKNREVAETVSSDIKKYTDPEHLVYDEQVTIVSVVNPYDSDKIGKKGIFVSHRNGNITVELDEGGFTVADKVYALRQAKKKRVYRKKKMSFANRAFLRFVMDYYQQNYDQLSSKKLSKLFGLNQNSVYTWWNQYRKDKDSFPRYTPEEAAEWSKQYGIAEDEPEEQVVEEPTVEEVATSEDLVTENTEEVTLPEPVDTQSVSTIEVYRQCLFSEGQFQIELLVDKLGMISIPGYLHGLSDGRNIQLTTGKEDLQSLIKVLQFVAEGMEE